MSTNCVRCIKNERTGFDLMCDACRDHVRLDLNVDMFAAEMKAVLHAKADQGYSGWDGAHPSDDLALQLNKDSVALIKNPKNKKLAIDIANRAMMLWRR